MTPPVKEPSPRPTPLSLVPCHGCRRMGITSGACHLVRGHDGRHECNAGGMKLHHWGKD